MESKRSRYDNLRYLALLVFMTTLLPEYGRDRSSYPVPSSRLDGVINNFVVTIPEAELSLLLWSLFMSGVSN
jgi:hypothetical protein